MIRADIDFKKDAITIAEQYGTPTFVLYEKILKENYHRFQTAFQTHYEKVKVSYSIKTNYLPAVLNILHQEGAGLEAVSQFEVYLALKMGVPAKEIIFNGPAKKREEINFAIKNDIFLINADSLAELRKINEVAGKNQKKVLVGLRINIDTLTWRKFGLPLKEAKAAFDEGKRMENVDICGIHVHIGSNMIGNLHPKSYLWTLEHITDLIKVLHTKGISIRFLDIGGGYPAHGIGRWPKRDRILKGISNRIKKTRFRKYSELFDEFILNRPIFPEPTPLEAFAFKIGDLIKSKLKESDIPLPTLILEPGRSVVNSAMTLLVQAVDIKAGHHKMVIADGGINLTPPAEHSAFHLMNVSGNGTEKEAITLAGPLCMESDILSKKAMVSPVKEGDILELFNVGAYSICRSNQFIRPRAQAVMVCENGTVEEIRKKEAFDDLVRLDRIPGKA